MMKKESDAKLLSTFNPETGVSKSACSDCGELTESKLNKTAYVCECSEPSKCSKCKNK